MKSTVWLIYVSSIVIMRIQADVQDTEDTSICSLCEDPTIPKCESTSNAKLDKQIDCKQKGCLLAEASETNKVCVLERASIEGTHLATESMNAQTQETVLPVPVALQMVSTDTAESATDALKEVNNPADVIVDNGNSEAEDNDKVVEQPEAAEQIDAQQEQNENNDASTEQVKEPLLVESENNREQAVETGPQLVESGNNGEQAIETGAEETIDMPGNAETMQVTSAEDVNVVQPVVEEAAVEPNNGAQSPDYPADAPAINEEEEANVDVDSPTVTADKPEGAEQTDMQNDDGNKETSNTNKDEVLVNNNDEQTALNDGVTAVIEHNEDTSSPANVDEPEIPINNVDPQNVANTENGNTANAPATVIVENVAPPANTAQSLSCYACSSTTDATCAPGPGRAVNCQAIGTKQNGCYTLYKADTNVTTRGCISELTNEGLKYCKSNAKQCILCYEKGCNNLLAPSSAIQSNSQLCIWLGIIGVMLTSYIL